ncbi:unnamed protein product [Pleuronectes platessa]|uniref:Uncharacterized protein n=1 Tax=Pleuronectes platessa TaxID=8262 RepID=A0A9N7UVH8_PLEPL|nr:unnamed protein product [Pleuronectes platessa]
MPPKAKPPVQLPRPAAHTASPPRSDSSTCLVEAAGEAPPHDFKAELLSSLRVEMAAIFKTELQAALTETLSSIKTELQAVKSELSSSITNIQSEVRTLKNTVEAFNLERSLSWTAHIVLSSEAEARRAPSPIIARLHYHTECVDILRRARTQQRIKIGELSFSVFPDHTPKTARARAAFNDVRRRLRKIPGSAMVCFTRRASGSLTTVRRGGSIQQRRPAHSSVRSTSKRTEK